jgi:chromosome transmission fidelity protein 18
MADLLEHELSLQHYDEDNFDDKYADEMDMLREWENEGPRNAMSSFKVLRPSNSEDTCKSVLLASGKEDVQQRGNEAAFSKDSIDSRSNSPLPLQISEDYDLMPLESEDVAVGSSENRKENEIFHQITDPTLCSEVSRQNIATSEDVSVLDSEDSPSVSSSVLPTSLQDSTVSSSTSLIKRGRVYSRVPPGPHMSLTGSAGKRVYLKICSEEALEISSKKTSGKKCQLLAMPFQHLRRQVEEARLRQSLQERKTQQLNEDSYSRLDSYDIIGSEGQSSLVEEENVKERVEQTLWVEKYTPLHFTQLLSDDGTNRTLLSWLKLWDKVVFGKSATTRAPKKTAQTKADNRLKNGRRPFPSKFEYQDPKTFSNPESLDTTGRPKLKIALLCGPPGLGKTTLAHVIARHAGYNVIELNASDDRSPEIFRQRIASSTQMQAVLSGDSRPNCLIIDEIDGAPAPSIAILLELIKRKEPTSTDGGKKKGKELLSRPIVCICNDQYVPALRELRQHALVMVFPPTLQARLTHRLMEVCKKESLRASIPALTALCDKADNDIRSCLNTLQFLKRRMTEITVSAVQSASIGQKDTQKNLFTLWKDIFQLPTVKKQSMILRRSQKEISKSDRFLYILYNVMSVGVVDKVLQGVFENYPSMRYRDPSMKMTSNVLEWMAFQDVVDRIMMSTQNYTLMPYLPFASVAAHIYLASSANAKVHYPHQQYEVIQNIQRSNNIIESLFSDMPPKTRNFMTKRNLTVEILPLVVETLSPTLRPVSCFIQTS